MGAENIVLVAMLSAVSRPRVQLPPSWAHLCSRTSHGNSPSAPLGHELVVSYCVDEVVTWLSMLCGVLAGAARVAVRASAETAKEVVRLGAPSTGPRGVLRETYRCEPFLQAAAALERRQKYICCLLTLARWLDVGLRSGRRTTR